MTKKGPTTDGELANGARAVGSDPANASGASGFHGTLGASDAERADRFASSLIDALPGVFYLYDDEGRFLLWNRDFEAVSGYSGAEIAAMHLPDFFAGDDKELLERRIAEVFERGESSVEADFVTKDGRSIPYYFTGKRVPFADRTCVVGVGLDISVRRQTEVALRKSELRYRTTLDTILEGCQILSFDWRYLYLNEAAALHNRRPNDELFGRTMQDAWPGIEDTHVYGMIERTLKLRVPTHEETEFAFPDGSTGWFDVRCQPVPEGAFVLSIDISERKAAERRLNALNEALERKVEERTRELEDAKVRAESADRLKSAFLATMSHELRTPLNSILGFTGILSQGLAGDLNDEQLKQLGMVQGSARHLLDLINDVLDISKIEAGQLTMRYSDFDLSESIEKVAETVRPLAERKGLDLKVSVAPQLGMIESDRRRVEQILLNLLNNASKFTERGGITLKADYAELHDPRTGDAVPGVRIAVEDTGIGMRAEDLGVLFQPFRQIDSGLERQHEGTGLGLAICRRLTTLLGGEIHARSVWRKGSVFTVELPRSRRK